MIFTVDAALMLNVPPDVVTEPKDQDNPVLEVFTGVATAFGVLLNVMFQEKLLAPADAASSIASICRVPFTLPNVEEVLVKFQAADKSALAGVTAPSTISSVSTFSNLRLIFSAVISSPGLTGVPVPIITTSF